MYRDEVIEDLVTYYTDEYLEQDTLPLRVMLRQGFKGFENFTDKELQEALEHIEGVKSEE